MREADTHVRDAWSIGVYIHFSISCRCEITRQLIGPLLEKPHVLAGVAKGFMCSPICYPLLLFSFGSLCHLELTIMVGLHVTPFFLK